MTTYGKETDLPVIGFDMGGTSTDVSRYGGNYEHVYESTTAGIAIQAPQVSLFFITNIIIKIIYINIINTNIL